MLHWFQALRAASRLSRVGRWESSDVTQFPRVLLNRVCLQDLDVPDIVFAPASLSLRLHLLSRRSAQSLFTSSCQRSPSCTHAAPLPDVPRPRCLHNETSSRPCSCCIDVLCALLRDRRRGVWWCVVCRDTRRSIGLADFKLGYASMVPDGNATTGFRFPDTVALGNYPADVHFPVGCALPPYVANCSKTLPCVTCLLVPQTLVDARLAHAHAHDLLATRCCTFPRPLCSPAWPWHRSHLCVVQNVMQ